VPDRIIVGNNPLVRSASLQPQMRVTRTVSRFVPQEYLWNQGLLELQYQLLATTVEVARHPTLRVLSPTLWTPRLRLRLFASQLDFPSRALAVVQNVVYQENRVRLQIVSQAPVSSLCRLIWGLWPSSSASRIEKDAVQGLRTSRRVLLMTDLLVIGWRNGERSGEMRGRTRWGSGRGHFHVDAVCDG
jgi:hypothetical protein